ncbi:MAG: plasmid maintenance protein CcdB [Alteromonadaceae bacterium]|nr:MAG: plasmid maintenance protein CcdB [Alteromonadaceae bacterium]
MAQFDVYQNTSKTTRKSYPYILDIQHDFISEISTRMVLPLGKLSLFQNEKMKTLTPVIDYEGEELILLTPQISSIPASKLKDPVGSLEHFRSEIIAAVDFAITGI